MKIANIEGFVKDLNSGKPVLFFFKRSEEDFQRFKDSLVKALKNDNNKDFESFKNKLIKNEY